MGVLIGRSDGVVGIDIKLVWFLMIGHQRVCYFKDYFKDYFKKVLKKF